MFQYILKRLLLMPPTFFMISLVVFFVLNIAPGRPGAQGQDMGEQADNAAQEESYRIFREQFNLDKPILFNLRPFTLSQEDVREHIVTAYDLEGEHLTKDRVRSKEKLDDLGNVMVRHLIELLDDPDDDVQRLAARRLTQAAQRRFDSDADSEAARLANREIGKKNAVVRQLLWLPDDPAERKAEVKAAWLDWWEQPENREYFTYTTGEKLTALVLETRFAKYWGNLLTLDFGVSTVDRRPVLPTLIGKLKYSISLTLVSVLLAYAIAVPIGVYSAVRQGTKIDITVSIVLFILYSLPTFFTGTVYLRLLTEGDPVAWFPTGGWASMDGITRTTLEQIGDTTWHLVLPIVTFSAISLAALSRYARTGVIDVIRSDYIRTARAKGLSEAVVIIKHAVRNGMIPILTLLAGLLPVLVGGSVVIEVIFNIPGMGLFLFDAINLRDYNVVMAVLLCSSLLSLVGILISDLTYALVDPRISFD